MKFTKIQGTGNDFIIIDDRDDEFTGKEKETAKKLCDRHFGIGADGILFIKNSKIAPVKMEIINSDGSYASMCGNGIRCFAKYIFEKGLILDNPVDIETGDGVKRAFLNIEDGVVESVTIDMGKPFFSPDRIPADFDEEVIDREILIKNKKYKITSMFMGVTHTVVFGKLDNYNICEGADIEKYDIFTERTNVNFCEVTDRRNIKVKTWEKGAGATLACGTGCCASVVAANRLGLVEKKVGVEIPGGRLSVEIRDEGIFMTGPAVISFEGECQIP
jgi:diaminopimelate epimerase